MVLSVASSCLATIRAPLAPPNDLDGVDHVVCDKEPIERCVKPASDADADGAVRQPGALAAWLRSGSVCFVVACYKMGGELRTSESLNVDE